jgi:3-oxoacyl-[acyl-carrier protein] reductase
MSERKETARLLQDKTAVIFGAGGAIGGQVARVFAREGATTFLSGRRLGTVEIIVKEIRTAKGQAQATEVDALDERAINDYLAHVVSDAGRIDIVVNAIGIPPLEYGSGTPNMELPYEQFLSPLTTHVGSQFLTARAAARRMAPRRSGAILTVSASPAKLAVPALAGFSATCAAIEGMTRSLAAEWGALGIRVVCLRPEAMPETRTIQQAFAEHGRTLGIGGEAMTDVIRERALLKRLPTLAETAEVAAFLVSDRASGVTGAVANVSCGGVID